MTLSGIVLTFICLWVVVGILVLLLVKAMVPYWHPTTISELFGDIVLWPWFLFNIIKHGP